MKSLDQEIMKKCGILASDSGQWKLKEVFPVIKMDHKKALQRFQPTIVLCSWMPHGEDLSRNFRETSSVQEYILIGDRECCGQDSYEESGIEDDLLSRYVKSDKETYFTGEKEGFIRTDMKDLQKLQFGRTDIIFGLEGDAKIDLGQVQ